MAMNSVGTKRNSGIDALLNSIFGNMKMGKKLALGFGVVLILMILLAISSIHELNIINDNLNKIVSNRYHKVVLSNDVIDQVNIIAVAVRNIAISKDSAFIQKESERIKEARGIYAKAMEELRATVVTSEGKGDIAEIDKNIAELKPFNTKIIESGNTMSAEEISKLLTLQLEPGQAQASISNKCPDPFPGTKYGHGNTGGWQSL